MNNETAGVGRRDSPRSAEDIGQKIGQKSGHRSYIRLNKNTMYTYGRVFFRPDFALLTQRSITHGLWSPLRGLARRRDDYYGLLHNADLPRRNDLDGRGALSQEHLVAFVAFFLETCLDQVRFIRSMLRMDEMGPRLMALLAFEKAQGNHSLSSSAADVLHYTFMSGPIERGRFLAMLGMPERTGRRTLAALLEYGLLTSGSVRGPLSFAVPFRSLRFLFPDLWPEAEGSA